MPQSIRPKKSLGQNFLSDPNTARKIVASLGAPPDAAVVEIGPGTGALTGELLSRYDNLTAIEVDARSVELLHNEYPRLDVRHADVLDVDWVALSAEKGGRLHVIGNLPYYITSQILFSLFDARHYLHAAVVMMQLEVAERLVAVPRTKAYGILSVLTQLYAEPSLLFRVSPHVFYPQPDVTSAVVRLVFGKDDEDFGGVDPGMLKQVVKAAFNQRRKTLRNSLNFWTKDRNIALPDDLANRRAEELTPGTFVELARYLSSAA